MRRTSIGSIPGGEWLLLTLLPLSAAAADVDVLHADSLGGPMRALKQAYEAKQAGITIRLTAVVSRELAARILQGEASDVFAPSLPAVIDQDLMNRKIAGTDQDAATWYVVFSANEMVVITAKGNTLRIGRIADLARPEIKLARVTGEKDLATGRTIEFLKRASTMEGRPELAQAILNASPADPAQPARVPDTINAVTEGRANAGIVYYSAAIAVRNDVDIVRFPDSVNLSDTIRNAATVPGTARNRNEAIAFVRFLLSPEAQAILRNTGQPPVVPPIPQGVHSGRTRLTPRASAAHRQSVPRTGACARSARCEGAARRDAASCRTSARRPIERRDFVANRPSGERVVELRHRVVRQAGTLDSGEDPALGSRLQRRERFAHQVQRANRFLAGKGLVGLGDAVDDDVEDFLDRRAVADDATVLLLQETQAITCRELVRPARIDDLHALPPPQTPGRAGGNLLSMALEAAHSRVSAPVAAASSIDSNPWDINGTTRKCRLPPSVGCFFRPRLKQNREYRHESCFDEVGPSKTKGQ